MEYTQPDQNSNSTITITGEEASRTIQLQIKGHVMIEHHLHHRVSHSGMIVIMSYDAPAIII